jgi:hypothetical protein
MRLKGRMDRLEKQTLEAAEAAINRLCPMIADRAEQLALWAVIQANVGTGPAVDDARTRQLSERAAARMWAAATDLERRLVWGFLPLPIPAEDNTA